MPFKMPERAFPVICIGFGCTNTKVVFAGVVLQWLLAAPLSKVVAMSQIAVALVSGELSMRIKGRLHSMLHGPIRLNKRPMVQLKVSRDQALRLQYAREHTQAVQHLLDRVQKLKHILYNKKGQAIIINIKLHTYQGSRKPRSQHSSPWSLHPSDH